MDHNFYCDAYAIDTLNEKVLSHGTQDQNIGTTKSLFSRSPNPHCTKMENQSVGIIGHKLRCKVQANLNNQAL